jgi:hypothetical protein
MKLTLTIITLKRHCISCQMWTRWPNKYTENTRENSEQCFHLLHFNLSLLYRQLHLTVNTIYVSVIYKVPIIVSDYQFTRTPHICYGYRPHVLVNLKAIQPEKATILSSQRLNWSNLQIFYFTWKMNINIISLLVITTNYLIDSLFCYITHFPKLALKYTEKHWPKGHVYDQS